MVAGGGVVDSSCGGIGEKAPCCACIAFVVGWQRWEVGLVVVPWAEPKS
jgi:hypothetical protein